MRSFARVIWLCLLFLLSATANAGEATEPPAVQIQRCDQLSKIDFSTIADAPSRIDEAKVIGRNGDVPSYCQVSGYVSPGVGFMVYLPVESWSGRFIQLGCGGFCGEIGVESTTGDDRGCGDLLRRGYACAVSNNGHTGTGALWDYNNLQAELDHSYRGAHVTALAGKAIVTWYYRREPRKSYFWGCSTGGRQALIEAQRFPWDFDGIIAGSPSIGVPELHMTLLWDNRALFDGRTGEPVLTPADINVLHQAVVAKCDLNDGIRDGLIGDPRLCAFDPAELRCTSTKNTGCLTDQKIDAVKKMYGGPTTSTGQRIYFPGAMVGSEQTWLDWFRGVDKFVAEEFRYSGFYPNPGPSWKPEDFDFDRDYRRLGVADTLYSAVNPDLRHFKAAGGKILSYVGWNDAAGMPLPVVDYYETVERTMGGRAATQDFFRLFTIPGMNHCGGGEGASAVDWLDALEAWVERDHAPDRLIGSHILLQKNAGNGLEALTPKFPLSPERIDFARPIYPYPLNTYYTGHGNPKSAASYEASEPGAALALR